MFVHRVSRSAWFMLAACAVAISAIVVPAVAGASHGHGHHPPLPKVFHSRLTRAQVARLSRDANQRVIVLLRNQYPHVAKASAARRARIASAETPIRTELSRLRARRVHAYRFINAISATMSRAEVTRLRSDPAVRAVVADTLVRAPDTTPQFVAVPSKRSHAATPNAGATSSTPEGSGTPADACPADPSQPLLEPEALQSMNVDFGPGGPPAAHSLANGTGVKVAVFPDGLDPNIPDFQRNGHRRRSSTTRTSPARATTGDDRR